MINSPATVIRQLLLDEAIVGLHTSDIWPCFIASLPDSDAVVDDVVSIYDTQGLLDGKEMKSGEMHEHFGIQIVCRSKDYADGWAKMSEIISFLDPLHNEEVTVGTDLCSVTSATRTSPILPIPYEDSTKRRSIFTLNYLLTINES